MADSKFIIELEVLGEYTEEQLINKIRTSQYRVTEHKRCCDDMKMIYTNRWNGEVNPNVNVWYCENCKRLATDLN